MNELPKNRKIIIGIVGVVIVLLLTLGIFTYFRNSNNSSNDNNNKNKQKDNNNVSSKDWRSYEIMINNVSIKLPCNLKEFMDKTGFNQDLVSNGTMIRLWDGYSYLVLTLNEKYIEGNENNLTIWYVSTLESGQVNVMSEFDRENTSFILPLNITIGSKLTDAINAYGDYDYTSDDISVKDSDIEIKIYYFKNSKSDLMADLEIYADLVTEEIYAISLAKRVR